MPQQKRNKQGNKRPNKKQSSKSKHDSHDKKKKQQINPLYDPRTTLMGKDLKKFVQSQVRQQIRPQLHAAQRQAKSLEKISESQVNQLLGLSKQANRNIGSYYDDLHRQDKANLARQQALGARLSGEVAASGTQAAQAVTGAADAANKRLDTYQGQMQQGPSSARAELQQLIAAQQGQTARENNAFNATASERNATWQSLLGGLAQANQARGGEILNDTTRNITNRITDLQNQYAPDIRQALGEAKDIRASKGDLRKQVLSETIQRERDYLLKKGALGVDKGQLKADLKGQNSQIALAKQYGKNKAKEQKRSLASQLAVIKAQGSNKQKEQIQSLQNQLKVVEAQSSAAAKKQADSLRSQLKVIARQQGGGKGNKLADYTTKQRKDAKQYVKQVYDKDTNWLRSKANQQALINRLHNSYRINPQLTKHFIQQFLKRGKKPSNIGDIFTDLVGGLNQLK